MDPKSRFYKERMIMYGYNTRNDVSQKFIKHRKDRKPPRRGWLAIVKFISCNCPGLGYL